MLDVIELVFDHGLVKAALKTASDSSAEEVVARLRAQVASAEARVRQQPFAVHPALAGLLPEPGLKPGAAYGVGSSGALLHCLLAEPSREGHWCAVIGFPSFAAEAAAAAGVRLDRLILVPHPGRQWLAVTAALAEVIPVLALCPSGSVRPSDATRLASRLRDRGGVLLVRGAWPRLEASFALSDPQWSGVGQGHGNLESRQVQVSVTARRLPGGRSARLLLPDHTGGLTPTPVGFPERLQVAG